MDEEEYRQTKQRAYKNGAQTIIALLSVALALLAIFTPAKWLAILSGWIYFFIWPAVVVAGRIARKKRREAPSLDEQPPAPLASPRPKSLRSVHVKIEGLRPIFFRGM